MTDHQVELLTSERNAALRDAWATRRENEALRERLHEIIAERNELRAKDR